MRRPAAVEPVKAILSMPGWETRYSLVSRPAGTMLTTPSGNAGFGEDLAQQQRVDATFPGDALRMTVQPASSAGIIFARADWCGAFQGMTAATTPTASRRMIGPLPAFSVFLPTVRLPRREDRRTSARPDECAVRS